MGIELGALELPITATGRDAVLKALADIDRAAVKASAPVTIPVQTKGAAEAAASLEVLHQVQGRVADRLRAMGAAEQDVQRVLERSGPTLQKVIEQSGQLHAIREALIAQNRRVGSSDVYGSGLDAITQRITLLKQGLQVEQTRAASLTKLQAAEQQLERALTRSNLTLKEQITLGVQLGRVKDALAQASRREAQAVDAVAAGMAKATTGANAMAAGIAAVSEQQRQATATAQHLATANQRLLAGMSASGRVAQEASAGSRAWAAGMAAVRAQNAGVAAGTVVTTAGLKRMTAALSQVAVVFLGTRSAAASLVTGGLLTLGASAGVILAVVAAAAAIAYAWDQLTGQARKTRQAVQELREELNKAGPQETALAGVQLLTDAVAKAEADIEGLKQKAAAQGKGGMALFAKEFAEAEANLVALRADLEKATARVGEIRQEAFTEETATLAKAIALRTASARQIQVATERMRLLDAAAKDETATLAEQNRAQEEANQLRSAFKKIADEEAEAAKENAEARKRQLQALLALAQINDLTAAQLATLRQRYDDVTAALERGNQSLEERKRLQDESRATFEALQAVGAATSFTRTTGGSTFGQPLEFEQPKTPSLDNLTFGADQDTTSSFFGGGALDGLTEQLDQQAQQASDRVKDAIANVQGQIDTSLDELHTTLAEGLTQSLVDGIAEGFERGIASGSIGEGAKALTAALLSGVGSAAISFGVASLGIAKLMLIIKKALSTLNPAVAIPAAIGLIALGAALKGAASRMFGGSGGSSGGADSPPPPQGSRLTLDERGTITNREPIPAASVRAPATERVRAIASLPPAPRESARVMAPATAAQQASKVEPARVVVQQSFTLLGAADPQTQRFISEASNAGARRGLKFGTAHHG